MPVFVESGSLMEQGLRQFMPAIRCVFADEPERVTDFLWYAHENPEIRLYVSPLSLSGVSQVPEVAAALLSAPDNVTFPRYFRGAGGVSKTYLNLGRRGQKDTDEAVVHELPRISDTLVYGHPSSMGIARILAELGSGETGAVCVFDTPEFQDTYRGYAELARTWFSCWACDSVLHWETRLGWNGSGCPPCFTRMPEE